MEKKRKKILEEKDLVIPRWREENSIEDIVPMAHSSEVSVGVLGELIDNAPSVEPKITNDFSSDDFGEEIDTEIYNKPLSGNDFSDSFWEED